AWGFFERSGRQALAPATYNPAANSWTTGPAAPAQVPSFGDAFWTGKQMIVWGYVSPGHLQGVAYDPATGKWSMLPASPLGRAGRDSMLAVWTGRDLVVCGGANPAGRPQDAAP